MSDDWPSPWQLSWAFSVLLAALVIVLLSPSACVELIGTGDAMHEEIADQVQVQVQVYQYSSVEEATLAASGRLEGVVIPSGLYSGVVGDTVIVVSGDVSVEEAEQVFRRLADR
ncbi:MAG: hypothetical protein HRU00_16435 [Myxococcales bacterium]|nr:hypothetical protein [Myxococcales bacterium]